MKRRYLLGLLGFPLGASASECAPPLWSSTCGKVDGQCPNCGRQAERLRRPDKTDDRYFVYGDKPAWLERCETCNDAYWRNA